MVGGLIKLPNSNPSEVCGVINQPELEADASLGLHILVTQPINQHLGFWGWCLSLEV